MSNAGNPAVKAQPQTAHSMLISPFSFDYNQEEQTLLVQFRTDGRLSKEYSFPSVPPFWAVKLFKLNRAKNFRRVAALLRRLGEARGLYSCVSQEKERVTIANPDCCEQQL